MSKLRRLPRTPQWLIDAAQHGNRHAQHQLLTRYEPLVHRVVAELKAPPHMTSEDLAQEARIGLVAAIRAWRPERGPFPRSQTAARQTRHCSPCSRASPAGRS